MKWIIKIAAKIILARLPVPYRSWKSIGAFKCGLMDDIDYSMKIFNLHANRAFPTGLPSDACVLELGPGDSVASALTARANGAACIYLVDVKDFATKNLSFYKRIASRMAESGKTLPDLSHVESLDELLHKCNSIYMTDGLSSLKSIPSASVNFIWSHSVLEHVRLCEFSDVLKELRRILKVDGLVSHNIDFQDHLSGGLNNLRFPKWLWESPLFVESGFYTNRIPALVMHRMFKDVGFKILKEGFGRWPNLPLKRKALSADFQIYADAELINRTSHILLAPR